MTLRNVSDVSREVSCSESDMTTTLLPSCFSMYQEGEVYILPTIRINGGQYRGKLSYTEVLRALCAGFNKNNEPAACNKVGEDDCRVGAAGERDCKARCAAGASSSIHVADPCALIPAVYDWNSVPGCLHALPGSAAWMHAMCHPIGQCARFRATCCVCNCVVELCPLCHLRCQLTRCSPHTTTDI